MSLARDTAEAPLNWRRSSVAQDQGKAIEKDKTTEIRDIGGTSTKKFDTITFINADVIMFDGV